MMNPISYGKQHITEKDISAVVEVLRGDYLTQGNKVREFEEKFADYIGCKYAVAVSNGTSALHLSALSLGVNTTSKVITSPITFAASANCIRYCGGHVDFCDIDAKTLLLDIDLVRQKLEKSPKGTYQGIIPVDFAGHPVNMEAFRELADEFDLWLLEDACHAPGGSFTDSKGIIQKCGNGKYADLAIFSFHPVKHITCGEGGMVTTNRKDLYEKLLQLRTHGITKAPEKIEENHGGWYYEMQELGYNYRLTDIQCALGISQLDRAEEGILKRHQIAQKYEMAFKNLPIKTIEVDRDMIHAYHLYVIQLENRKALFDALRKENIFTQIHYIPVHLQPYYKKLYGFKKGDFPHAEGYYQKCLSLPMYPTLLDEEQEFVIKYVKEFCE
jgi:UDP-4-amino-4,6-dideoxy-N-acetyl-beta-L-altrosamine transaminase